MASALDYRPPAAGSQYDPETIAMMKQLGIWHPNMSLTPDSKRGQHEDELMQHIAGMRAHQQNLDESLAARKDARDQYAQQRSDTASMVEQGRNDRAQQVHDLRDTAEKDRVTQGLFAAANGAGTSPQEHKALMNEYLKRLGVSPETIAAAVPKPQGEFGAGGAKPVATAPNAGAVPTPTNTPYGNPTRFNANAPDINTLQHSAPAGYDFNAGTNEYVRHDQPGYINGKQVGGPAVGPNPVPKEAAITPPETYRGSEATPTASTYQPPPGTFGGTPAERAGAVIGDTVASPRDVSYAAGLGLGGPPPPSQPPIADVGAFLRALAQPQKQVVKNPRDNQYVSQ